MKSDFLDKHLIFIAGPMLLAMAVAAGSQSPAPNFAAPQSLLNWRPWSDAGFAEAKPPDMIVTTHGFLKATAIPRRSPGT